MQRKTTRPLRSRRGFLKIAGAAGLSAALASPMLALAQTAAKGAAKPKPVTLPAPIPGATPEKPSEFAPDAQHLTEIVKRRYGKYLNADQMKDVTEDLDQYMQLGKALRDVKLGNGEDPLEAFRA